MREARMSIPSANLDTQWIAQFTTEPEPILAFCRQHGILVKLETAVELARECFEPSGLQIEPEQDPETGEQWLVIRVAVAGEKESLRQAYRNYVRQWLRLVPEQERFLIRLSYDPT
jgi:hypothetical protein